MSKIDELISGLARIETKIDNIDIRLDKHSKALDKHEVNLNGNAEQGGLNEWRRNFKKRHIIISGLLPSGIVVTFETIKRVITGHW